MAKRGRPRDDCGPYNLKALCKIETLKCIETLKKVRDDVSAPPQARVKASEAILDRGWGKPTQAVEMTVDDKRSPAELTRDELAAEAARILAGDRARDPGGIPRPN